MSSKQLFHIDEFGPGVDESIIRSIYKINQSNTPEVGELKSIKKMTDLIKLASKNVVIKNNNEIIGFAVCFRENSKYKSLNYKHISSLKNKFLYIDRVAIKNLIRAQELELLHINFFLSMLIQTNFLFFVRSILSQ